MGNEQSQNGRGGYQIDEITYAKGGGILNAYMYAQVGNVERFEQLVIRCAQTKWMAPNKCHGIFFVHVRPSTLENHHQQGKCHCFLPS